MRSITIRPYLDDILISINHGEYTINFHYSGYIGYIRTSHPRYRLYQCKNPKTLPVKGGGTKTVTFTEWQLSSLKAALNSAGITTFAQFQTMRANHFEQMVYPGRTGPMKLPVYT